MKLLFFFSAFLILCRPAAAQDKAPPVVEDFAKKINNSTAMVVDEHLNVLALQTDDDKYDVVGVDDKMQQVWKIPVAGDNLWMKKFKSKILVLTSLANKSRAAGDINYTAYVVDPATGKITTSKVVYHATSEFVQQPQLFTGDGDFFKLAVRTTTRKENIGMFAEMFKSGSAIANEWNQTADLRIISYTEKLDTINTLRPVLTNGIFLSLTVSKNQDVFIGWFNGPSMEIYKYDAGQTKPSNFLAVPVDFKPGRNSIVANSLFLRPSENKNILNFGLIYSNEKGFNELGIGRLNFSTNQKNFVTQAFDKANLNAWKKNFQPLNKDLDDVDFGLAGGMTIQYLEEVNGKIVVAAAPNWHQTSRYGTIYATSSMVLNGYDENLNLKFSQVLPTNAFHGVDNPTISFHVRKNELNILANTKNGIASNACAYAVLDLNTGKWAKMYKLSKKKIAALAYSKGSSVLWFGDRFVLPYFSLALYSATKNSVTLQTNLYQD
ncbi:hypothetical protein ACFQZS_10950 [Mucilaginibacter calamicampi]|uniref:Uncharacterized protein n=1 Tax=Mucilaginibacter calamicampi TaxID=1302352 RepID=A0ABW2YWU5_9SPHI